MQKGRTSHIKLLGRRESETLSVMLVRSREG